MNYESTANKLVNRILSLIPSHPEILEMDSAWDLFGVEGFRCDDLQPSLAQAQWALAMAIKTSREQGNSGVEKTAS